MSSERPRIACALCLGSATEPYLAATLASIAGVVDDLVVNDNSGLPVSPNAPPLAGGPFRSDRLHVMQTRFVDFATMRNDAHAALSALKRPPDWVLFIDADEVHGTQLEYIANRVLPRLEAGVAQVDAYTYHFWGTFGWITDIARRMSFYRFSPALRWVNPVHEKLIGLGGSAVVLPYVYHHYGNVLPPQVLAQKHQRYYELGNPVPEPPQPEAATLDMFLARANEVRPFGRHHPVAARPTLEEISAQSADAFAVLERGFASHRSVRARMRSALAGLNESLRVGLRGIEHPGLYRAPRDAR